MLRSSFMLRMLPSFVLLTGCSVSPLNTSDEGSAAGSSLGDTGVSAAALSGPCGLSSAAFCDPFDAPAAVVSRAGQLDGVVWGVSRAFGSGANFGQAQYGPWGTTSLDGCSGTSTVAPPSDVVICDGQLREASNDLHDVTNLAMYPKQPFDFAERTGIISFDVSNDTLGNHSEWPELWMSDQPVPTPFAFGGSWLAAPRHGFGLRFSAATKPLQGANIAPACPNDSKYRWSMGSAVVVRNYVVDDQDEGGATKAEMLDCVTRASRPGEMNHIEVHVSRAQIDVYATDAGTTGPLKHIAVVRNANLSFTRGLVWLEDVHYNAEKDGGPTQHTFVWDNLGFDGPVLARDLAFDALDALTPVPGYPGLLNLGWDSKVKSGRSFTVNGVFGISDAASALLTFNFYHYDAPRTLTYVVNGHTHSLSWPFPDRQGYTWRTLAVPVPLSEISTGSNTINVFSKEQELSVANVDIVLVGAGGVPTP